MSGQVAERPIGWSLGRRIGRHYPSGLVLVHRKKSGWWGMDWRVNGWMGTAGESKTKAYGPYATAWAARNRMDRILAEEAVDGQPTASTELA